MGGIIILGSVLIPVLLLCDLSNIYIKLMIISTVWLGILGFADDYIKVFRKHKEGLQGKFKVIGQVGLGIIVGTIMCFSEQVVVVDKNNPENVATEVVISEDGTHDLQTVAIGERTTKTTIPFVKDNEFDYGSIVGQADNNGIATWLLYMMVAVLVITAVSNSANLTDGIDGLATGVSVPIVLVLGAFAWLSGNIIYAGYLNFMYIPDSGELLVYAAAMAGALLGFMWYNCFPAQVFMGDTGSLALGGIIAVAAIILKKELLIPVMCGIFLVESLSVIMQRYYFKYTKKKYGEGRRIFKMSPLHHHFQKEGIPAIIQTPKKALPEAKIVVRFWIITILLCTITIITLKIR
jgi:phospho-N-acetylmuramoyl-pentapeptide-transferase